MSALLPWLVSQVGQFGAAIILVGLLAVLAYYLFWSIAFLLVVGKLRRDRPTPMEGN